ncbi:MAG: TonB-dependent receptor domain-containing protein [Myxococcaceae bacterium]
MLLIGSTALAQGTGVITGTVTDASTNAPVPDVVVTATSPKLQGEQIVVTDSTGLYRIPQLPPGPYTLRFERESYHPYQRGNVELRLDQTLRVNVNFMPEAITADEIVVVGRQPEIDVGSAAAGININADFIRNLAISRPGSKGGAARSFESLAEFAPGANADTYGVSISGATSPENQFIIDGLSVNDPGNSTLGTPLSVSFIQEVNVVTGGYLPEYGRSTGGVMNAVTKSGSNEFHGSIWGNWAPGLLQATPAPVRQEGTVISARGMPWNEGDFGLDLGGPIIKDRVWFYAGVAPSFSRIAVDRQLNTLNICTEANPDIGCAAPGVPQKQVGTNFTQTTPIDGTLRRRFADQRAVQYLAKLTYLVNKDHNVSFSIYGNPQTSGRNGGYSFSADGAPEVCSGLSCTAGVQGDYGATSSLRANAARDLALKYTGSFFEKAFLIDGTLGWHHQDYYVRPSDGTQVGSADGLAGTPLFTYRRTSGPGVHVLPEFEALPDPAVCGTTLAEQQQRCPVRNYSAGGYGTINDHSLDRYQGKIIGTVLWQAVGHHITKAGFDAETTSYFVNRARTGGAPWRECTNGSCWFTVNQYGYLSDPDSPTFENGKTGTATSLTLGGFIQDSWSILDAVTVNLGVRYDTQVMWGQDKKIGMVLPNQWSPRAGVIYDFTQAGRSKLFANFARYFETVPLAIADLSFPQQRLLSATYDNPPCLPSRPGALSDGSCGDASRQDLGGNASPNRRWDAEGGDRVPVDPSIQAQSSDEIQLGAEYEVVLGRLGAVYTRRYMNNVVEDMSRDDGATFFIGNPGKGFAGDFPRAERNYDAVSIYYSKAFSSSWLAQVSYTYASLRGNYNGLFRADTNQLEPNVTRDFDLLELTVNRYGPLPADFNHSIKAFGAKEFKITDKTSLNIGLSYRGRSGGPINYTGLNIKRSGNETYILPRGSAGRLPWVHGFDTHIGLDRKLVGDLAIGLTVDVFNLFNFQAVTAVDQLFANTEVDPILGGGGNVGQVDACVRGAAGCAVLNSETKQPIATSDVNPNYKNPTQFQTPRSVRIGLRLTF